MVVVVEVVVVVGGGGVGRGRCGGCGCCRSGGGGGGRHRRPRPADVAISPVLNKYLFPGLRALRTVKPKAAPGIGITFLLLTAFGKRHCKKHLVHRPPAQGGRSK